MDMVGVDRQAPEGDANCLLADQTLSRVQALCG